MLTPRQRWQQFFLRLNQIEARADDPERAIMARFLLGRIVEDVPDRLILRPREGETPEPGPPCLRCTRELRSSQLLVACTVCLNVAHHECWRRSAGCPTPACVEERQGAALPYRQPQARRSG